MPLDYLKEKERVKQCCKALSISPTDSFLIVSVEDQEMAYLNHDEIVQIYPISTAKNPPSCFENSFGTPTGLHALADFIGADTAEGTVFKGRVSTEKHYANCELDEQSRNLITSRIIRLRGLNPDLNQGPGQDSYERYIYIHGTNHEERIGEPFSGGCIEMRNADVIELFNRASPGELIWIV